MISNIIIYESDIIFRYVLLAMARISSSLNFEIVLQHLQQLQSGELARTKRSSATVCGKDRIDDDERINVVA